MSENIPDHFCPGCGKRQKHFARYPWYFCSACVALAQDCDGRGLKFFNTGLSGGIGWGYGDEPELVMTKDVSCVICLIHCRKVIVHEARFGGVVCEPVENNGYGAGLNKYRVNLAVKYDVDAMRKKMTGI